MNVVSSLKKNSVLFLLVVVCLLFVIVIFLAWYVFDSKSTSATTASIPPTNLAGVLEETDSAKLDLSNKDPEVGGVVERVSKHMLLPKAEITVATVNDAEGLRRQDLFSFQYTRNGDKLLLYEGGVIIYDPVQDKIVDAVRFPVKSPADTELGS